MIKSGATEHESGAPAAGAMAAAAAWPRRPLGRELATVAAITVACLILTLCSFAPRLWLMREVIPGTFQWDRALTYLRQCEQPLRRDIEPAMLWRLLPPLVARGLRLKGRAPLVLPWIGIVVATGYVVVLCRRRTTDRWMVWGTTLLFCTSSAVLTPAHWLGLNDCWVWLALLAVAFGRTRYAIPIACLLGPWVDERFIIGLPLALLVRRTDRAGLERIRDWLTSLWLLPYALLRIAYSLSPEVSEPTQSFLRSHLQQVSVTAVWAALGWWMAWRAGWLLAIMACRSRVQLAFVAAGTLLASFVLAADLSRSAAILAPLVLLGSFEYMRRTAANTSRHFTYLALACLLIPAAHVSYNKFDLINNLAIEWFRLWRAG